VPKKPLELKFRYDKGCLISDMHCRLLTNHNRVGHLTNQNRAGSQKGRV